jgi:hypothetical protein
MLYYCADITENNCSVCDTELGRVRKLALVHSSFYQQLIGDITNISLWDLGRTLGKVFVYPEVQGEFDGGVPVMVRGFASNEDIEVAKQYSLDLREPNYIGNREHFNEINGSRQFYAIWASETLMYVSTRPVYVSVKAPIANDLKTEVVWQIAIKYTAQELPLVFDRDDNVLQCQYNISPPPYGSFDDSFDNSFDN